MSNPPSKKAHLKHSNLLITINTNIPIHDITQESGIIETFRQALAEIFTEDFFGMYYTFKDSGQPLSDLQNTRMFKNHKIMVCLEIGEQKKCLHSHIGCFLSHYTKIAVKPVLFDNMIKILSDKGFQGCHINKVWSNNYNYDQDLEDYITKNPI